MLLEPLHDLILILDGWLVATHHVAAAGEVEAMQGEQPHRLATIKDFKIIPRVIEHVDLPDHHTLAGCEDWRCDFLGRFTADLDQLALIQPSVLVCDPLGVPIRPTKRHASAGIRLRAPRIARDGFGLVTTPPGTPLRDQDARVKAFEFIALVESPS